MQEYEEECVVGSQSDFNFPCVPLWLSVLSEENHRGTQRNTEGYKGIDRCIESQGNHENVNKACHKAPNSAHRHERSTCTSMEEECVVGSQCDFNFPCGPLCSSVVIGFERGEQMIKYGMLVLTVLATGMALAQGSKSAAPAAGGPTKLEGEGTKTPDGLKSGDINAG